MVDSRDSSVVSEKKSKHPPRSYRDVSVPAPSGDSPVISRITNIGDANRSYPSGSAAGPDRVTPQILKDLISQPGEASQSFLSSLTSFVNIVLPGKAPCLIRPHFFGANLFALRKKCGGVRPLDVDKDNVVLGLASTCGGCSFSRVRKESYVVRQLSYGTPRGAEAAVYTKRKNIFENEHSNGKVLLEIDFKNAFNSVSGNKLFFLVHDRYPGLNPYTHAA